MTKEELVEFLEQNLRVEVDYFAGNEWSSKSLTVKLFVGNIEIHSTTEYMYD